MPHVSREREYLQAVDAPGTAGGGGQWVAPPNSPKEGPWLDFCTTLAKEEDAEWLAAELTKRGYRTPPNTGRFNFCGTLAKEDAEWLKAELTKRGYLK